MFRDGVPVALIDFDLARPTTRLYDIANALFWWVPLSDPRDRSPAFAGLDAVRRTAVFADAYGMTARQREDLVPLATRMVRRFGLTARAAAGVDPVFRRIWEDGAKDRLPRAGAWLARTGPAIAARLTAAPYGPGS